VGFVGSMIAGPVNILGSGSVQSFRGWVRRICGEVILFDEGAIHV
jgi:hypothetical protein